MKLISANSGLSKWHHSFCALGRGGSVQEHLLQAGAEVCTLQKAVRIPSASAVFALWRYLRKLKPRVLHLHGAEANFHGVIAGRLARVPVIISEEIGIPNHSQKARRVFAWVYRRADRVIAISQAVKDELVRLEEATPAMVEVIHNPFEWQSFRASPERNGAIRLGFVGRLEAVKNPMAAVEAVSILRKKGFDVSLRLVGDGSQKTDLKRLIDALGLSEHIELSGFHHRPFELLQDCHIYLQPSVTEGFGLAICEAMSSGIPVIATAVGGVPEIIDHGVTGWLVPSPDARSLAEAVEFAKSLDNDSLKRIADEARTTVMKRFGVATYLNRLDELYQSLSER